MSKEMGVIVLGIFVAVVPYLGIPWSWKTPILLLAGLAVALVGFLLRGETLSNASHRGTATPESHPFVESATAPREESQA